MKVSAYNMYLFVLQDSCSIDAKILSFPAFIEVLSKSQSCLFRGLGLF